MNFTQKWTQSLYDQLPPIHSYIVQNVSNNINTHKYKDVCLFYGCFDVSSSKKLSEPAPSRASGPVAEEAWLLSTNQGRRSRPSQDVCLIPEHSPESS